MKHIKLISGLIALSIAASTLLPIAVSADTNTEERKLINVSPINEDDDFPLYADIEFSESSIHFIDVDCYECEYGVDKSRLESSIILRAKENDTEFEISLCSNEPTTKNLLFQLILNCPYPVWNMITIMILAKLQWIELYW